MSQSGPGPLGSAPKDSDVHVQDVSKHDLQDRQHLARVGKNQVLRRSFGFFSIVGLSCTVLITWEASLTLFQQGLSNGGPAGIIYGFLFVWLGNLSVFSTLSELASMAPTSGGQYHWVSMLAPRSCSKVLSYVTGWLTVGGWQGTVATAGYLCGSMIQSLIAMTVPSYEPQPYQGMLLSWSVACFCVLINTMSSIWLPRFEGLLLVLHIGGFVAILVPVVVLGPRGDAATVFATFNNGGNWPMQELSFFVGAIAQVFAFVGGLPCRLAPTGQADRLPAQESTPPSMQVYLPQAYAIGGSCSQRMRTLAIRGGAQRGRRGAPVHHDEHARQRHAGLCHEHCRTLLHGQPGRCARFQHTLCLYGHIFANHPLRRRSRRDVVRYPGALHIGIGRRLRLDKPCVLVFCPRQRPPFLAGPFQGMPMPAKDKTSSPSPPPQGPRGSEASRATGAHSG